MGDSGPHHRGHDNNDTRNELHRGKKRSANFPTPSDAYKTEATFSPPVDSSPPDLGAPLLERHYDGDDDAFQEFVQMYQSWLKKPIHSFAKQLDLDDVVQSVLVRIFEQRSQVPHSHPRRARTSPSPTDLCQLGWLASTLSMDGCPGLMLIAGDKGVSINLGELIEQDGTAS